MTVEAEPAPCDPSRARTFLQKQTAYELESVYVENDLHSFAADEAFTFRSAMQSAPQSDKAV